MQCCKCTVDGCQWSSEVGRCDIMPEALFSAARLVVRGQAFIVRKRSTRLPASSSPAAFPLPSAHHLASCQCQPKSAHQRALVATVDSDDAHSSAHSTPRLPPPPPPKTDVDSHFRLDSQPSTSSPDTPPTFSSHNFPSRYFPPDSSSSLVVSECAAPESLTAFAPSGPAPPFEEAADDRAASLVVAETKAALPRDTKDSKDLDDGEPPPPYTEGSSPLEGFTYVMSAAGGAASIITQVQQGGPVPLNTSLAGRRRLMYEVMGQIGANLVGRVG